MQRQLDVGCAQLREANPRLYRDLALYLQVLREVLPGAVEQACFHLAVRFHPQRYCELPAEHRRSLHLRRAALVRQATSLLTVEQLRLLAGRLAAGRRRRRRDLLDRLRPPAAAGLSAAADPEREAQPEPEGSVQLGLDLPVDLRVSVLPPLWSGEPEPSPGDFPAMEELADTGLSETGPEETGLEPAPPPWDSPLLPAEPLALLRWLDGSEQALAQRLRGVSHALNLELLRAGLCRSLLPESLLEAALRGQLEPLSAPANLLRVQLPVPHPGGQPLESVAVLLRAADLELEHPRLRSCRARLQRHRQEVRRMADQHRRLQRRLQALEAERLWHQDNPRSPQP